MACRRKLLSPLFSFLLLSTSMFLSPFTFPVPLMKEKIEGIKWSKAWKGNGLSSYKLIGL